MFLKSLGLFSLSSFIFLVAGCAYLSPEMQESIEDARGSLPSILRGSAKPLEEYPQPNLNGTWRDDDYPELTLRMSQNGARFLLNRNGERGGIVVRERIRGNLTGRAIKAKYINDPPDALRATSGNCTGSVSRDSTALKLSCTYGGRLFPLNFTR